MQRFLLTGALLLASVMVVQPAAATSCDPTTAADPSCGLKTAIEAKYGEGYCADLYEWQDVGGATLEVFHRYTDASTDSNGAGSFTIELFPTFTDTECTIKTTSALEGNDPTYRFYQGISLGSTSDITTSAGEEEVQVDLEPNQFEYTLTGLDFTEYQNRFDSNFYDETGTDRYDSTTEQDYFAPAWPALTSLTMAEDGTFEWGFADGPADSDTRADIVLYKIVDGGLQYTTFTSKYAPTDSWEYYDWNNVGEGTYLLDGAETKKSYYDDYYDGSSMDVSGQINHNIFSEHTRKVVTIKNHKVVSVKSIGEVSEDTSEALTDCAAAAEDGEDCSLDAAPEKTTVQKASTDKVTWIAVDGATYYKLVITNAKDKTLVKYDSLTGTSKKLKASDKSKLLGKNKNYAKVFACNAFGCSAPAKKQF
jgi:hypothetical protein